jgi:hypothetical protein
MTQYITARRADTKEQVYLSAETFTEAWKLSQQLLSLGEHRYIQVRFRKSKPKEYKELKEIE